MNESSAQSDALLHITDPHFWRIVWNPFRQLNKRILGNANVIIRRRRWFPLEHAEPFAEHLAAIGPRDLLITGDLTSTATDEEFAMATRFLQSLRDRGFRIVLLPGNHDVYTFESVRARRFEKYLHEFALQAPYPQRVILSGGTPLILVKTVRPNYLTSRGHVSQAMIDAVAECVQRETGPVLVASHYPLLPKTEQYASPWSHRLGSANRLRMVLGETGKKILCIAGHVHRNGLLRDAKYPNLTHIVTGAFFRKHARAHADGAFSEIHVDPQEPDAFRIIQYTHRNNIWES